MLNRIIFKKIISRIVILQNIIYLKQYIELKYLYSIYFYCPHVCWCYHSGSTVVPSSLPQVYINLGNQQGIPNWTLYGGRLFSFHSPGISSSFYYCSVNSRPFPLNTSAHWTHYFTKFTNQPLYPPGHCSVE